MRPISFSARGKAFTWQQLYRIADLVERYHEEGRTKISQRVCKTLRWLQPNGRLKEVACREVLRKLAGEGVIEIPPPRTKGAVWKKDRQETYAGDMTPVTVVDLRKVCIKRVTTGPEAALWNQLVSEFHYLHSARIVGRQAKYFCYAEDRPIACLGWGDGSWAIKARDRWIGWTQKQRMMRLRLVVNNVRFLILPWVKVPNLASYLLSKCGTEVVKDWGAYYGYRPVLFETFVDVACFRGTCYKAANWINLGLSSGYAKTGAFHHNSQTPKALFVLPVRRDFRRILKGSRI